MFFLGTDILAPVQPIDMKFSTVLELCPGHIFCPFGGDILRSFQMLGQQKGSGGEFWAFKTFKQFKIETYHLWGKCCSWKVAWGSSPQGILCEAKCVALWQFLGNDSDQEWNGRSNSVVR